MIAAVVIAGVVIAAVVIWVVFGLLCCVIIENQWKKKKENDRTINGETSPESTIPPTLDATGKQPHTVEGPLPVGVVSGGGDICLPVAGATVRPSEQHPRPLPSRLCPCCKGAGGFGIVWTQGPNYRGDPVAVRTTKTECDRCGGKGWVVT